MDNNNNANEDLILTSPRGVDPLKFSITLFLLLILFVLYLLLPKGVRKQYFRAYPKRHAWSARSRLSSIQPPQPQASSQHHHHMLDNNNPSSHYEKQLGQQQHQHYSMTGQQSQQMMMMTPPNYATAAAAQQQQQHPEVMVSAAMQQLRTPGVLIVAHGSRGKPKTVRLQLTDTAITWRTESSGGNNGRNNNAATTTSKKTKFGKLHAVPLQAVMYVDVGKQTTALRRVENASVQEALCFSLLTKEGSLDLEASSVAERDALVSCFSLVLDEVHAQNWRDIYRGPSSDHLPSSFDEMDQQQQVQQPAQIGGKMAAGTGATTMLFPPQPPQQGV